MEVRIGICRTDFCRKESDNFRFIEGIEYVTSKRQYDTDAGSRIRREDKQDDSLLQ